MMSAPASFIGVGALQRSLDAEDGAGVGAGHNHEVGVHAGIHGGLDFAHHFLHGDNLAAHHVAALLGHHLILQLDDGHAGLLVLADGADDVDGVAEAGVGVGDDGHAGGLHHVGGTHDHLAHAHQAHVGLAQVAGGLAVAGHIDGVKAQLADDLAGEHVVGAGGDDGLLAGKEFAHLLRSVHIQITP